MTGRLDLFQYNGKIIAMETILSLFVFQDTYVVSFLVVGITIVVVMLLLFNQKSPESIVKSEVGGNDNIEGALRRVLGEKQWLASAPSASTQGASVGENGEILKELEKEVLEKDRTIAELNKQLTQSGGAGEGGVFVDGDNSELMKQIAELEARLQEYEIIEDDIADLSLYKSENEKLKEELGRLKSQAGIATESTTPVMPVDETTDPEPSAPATLDVPEEEADSQSADLVAEFEKVVNSQANIGDDQESSRISIKGNGETGKVVMAGEGTSSGSNKSLENELASHPKLKNISPDSKEEADIFISELKSLKKGS